MSTIQSRMTLGIMRTLLLAALLLSTQTALATHGDVKEDEGASAEQEGAGPEDAAVWESNWHAEVGLGFDSNVYAAPNAPYVDYGDIGGLNPTVVPVRQSGAYVPLSLKGQTGTSVGNTDWLASYAFDGLFYTQAAQSNADTMTQRLELGSEIAFRQEGKRRDALSLTLRAADVRETYTDHDSGEIQLSSGLSSLADRYKYSGGGFDIGYRQRTTPIKFSVDAELESRNYAKPSAGREYDNNFTRLQSKVQVPLGGDTDLRFSYAIALRDYSDRRARDAKGQLDAAHNLVYLYNDLTAGVRQRLSDDWVAYLDHRIKSRSDQYVGYSSYVLRGLTLRGIYHPEGRFSMRLKAGGWVRKYPNAFAFDTPLCGSTPCEQKAYEGLDAVVKATFAHTPQWSYTLELSHKARASTDLRYAYDQQLMVLGTSIEF